MFKHNKLTCHLFQVFFRSLLEFHQDKIGTSQNWDLEDVYSDEGQ